VNRAPSDRRRFHRRTRNLIISTILTSVLMTSCTRASNDDAGTQSTLSPPPPPTIAADPVETPCLSANPGFTARGTVSILGGSGPDAGQLSAIDWLTTAECERIVFAFVTNASAPASSIGLTRLEFFPEQAILRVAMPRDVDVTAVADALFDGGLVQRAFVVRSRSGELAVDLHLDPTAPIEARGLVIGSPVRLVVDVRLAADSDAIDPQPASSVGSVVVLSPAPGPTEYPLRIRGYARTTDDVVTARVDGRGAFVERRITAASSRDAWGEFAVTISEGPEGEITLSVGAGDQSPRDGVEITLYTP